MNAGEVPGDAQPRRQYKPERPTPDIPLENFLEAQRDPKVKKFLREAQAESQELKDKGQIHF